MVASSKLVVVAVNLVEVLAAAPAVAEEAVVEALPVAEQDQEQVDWAVGLVASVELLAGSAVLGGLVARAEVVLTVVEATTQTHRHQQRQR